MAGLMLTELISNLSRLRRSGQLLLIGCLSSVSFAQDQFFKLNEGTVFPIDAASVTAAPYEQFQIAVDTLNGLLYAHLGSKAGEGLLYIFVYDLTRKSQAVHTVKLGRELDFRYKLLRIYIDPLSCNLIIPLGDQLFEIDRQTMTVSTVHKGKVSDYFFTDKKALYFGNYLRWTGKGQEQARIERRGPGRAVRKLDFSTEDVALTAFTGKKLICNSPNYIFCCHVSRPVIYRYHHDLRLVDSLIFDTFWRLPESLRLIPEYNSRIKRDPYSFYMKAIDDGIHVNSAVHLLNDSTVYIHTLHGMTAVNGYIIYFDRKAMRPGRKTMHEARFECSDPANCSFLNQLSFGTVSKDVLYYLTIGKANLPWEAENVEALYSKFVYIHLYSFKCL